MVKQSWIRIVLQGCFAFLLASCSGTGPASPAEESLAVPASPAAVAITQMKPDEMPQPTPPSGLDLLIDKAREDLAQRLSIPTSQVKLVEAKPVVWPDASLGCPQPGMEYKQVPYDGALILLEVQGITYEYHNGGSRGLFLCEKTISKPEKSPQINITDLAPPTLDNDNSPGKDQ